MQNKRCVSDDTYESGIYYSIPFHAMQIIKSCTSHCGIVLLSSSALQPSGVHSMQSQPVIVQTGEMDMRLV